MSTIDWDAKWAKVEKIEWDGKTFPLCEFAGDAFFWSEGDVVEHLDYLNLTEIRLCLCRQNVPSFDMQDLLDDCYCDDIEYSKQDVKDIGGINQIVTDWIDKHKILYSWEMSYPAKGFVYMKEILSDGEATK